MYLLFLAGFHFLVGGRRRRFIGSSGIDRRGTGGTGGIDIKVMLLLLLLYTAGTQVINWNVMGAVVVRWHGREGGRV